MTTSLRELRDSRVDAHVEAIRSGEGYARLWLEDVASSSAAGLLMADTYGGTYDEERTLSYLSAMADDQAGLLLADLRDFDVRGHALGFATAAVTFGTLEFTRQDPRRWTQTFHHSGSANARPVHRDQDGGTLSADDSFAYAPGGAGCGCWIGIQQA